MAERGNERRVMDVAASKSVSSTTPLRSSTAAPREHAGGGEAASPEGASALLALDVNLAHNELRAMLDAVYDEMDALRRQSRALQEENERLREEAARRQEEFACAVDQRGADVTRLESELLDAKQQHQILSSRHKEQQSERARLEAVVEARDKTIAEMKKLVEETTEKRKAGIPAGLTPLISEEELKRVITDFSRRERQVYDNMDYVRKASGGLQVATSELTTHISELRREMARLQQQHAEYKAYIDNHRCNTESTGRNGAEDVAAAQIGTVDSRKRDDNEELEQRVASLELERDALKLRCETLDADMSAIQKQLADATRSNAASRDLIAKYEESALDGTQTIDGLQESLLAVCAQLEEERDRHRRALQEAALLSAKKARDMQAEITRLSDKNSTMNTTVGENETTLAIEIARADLQAALEAETARTGATPAHVHESSPQPRRSGLQRAPESRNGVRESPRLNARPGATSALVHESSPHSRRSSLERVRAARTRESPRRSDIVGDRSNSKRSRSQNVEEIDDSDIEEGVLATIAETARNNVAKKAKKDRSRAPPLDPKAPCAGCRGEPFGFMVRCHKCKGQFHISCTKSTQESSTSKRKMRHVFQCAKCTPALQQRPSKVPRKSKATSAA